MSRIFLKHRLEHLGVRVLVAGVSRLPERLGWMLGGMLGRLAGSVFRIRRSVVDANLKRAFPDRSPTWRNRIARDTYLHFAREAVQLARLERTSRPALAQRIGVENVAAVRDALEAGRGVVVLTAHFGNWEIGAAGLTTNGIELAAVVKRQANPLFDTYMRDVRERLGMSVVYREKATRRVLELLRRPHAVALVADQNAGRSGIFVDFFGVPASTVRGPAVLADRTGADVIFAEPKRLPGVQPRYALRFVPVEWDRTADPEERVRELLQEFMRLLEEAVRQAPEQYFWFHKRWKTRPVPAGNEEARA